MTAYGILLSRIYASRNGKLQQVGGSHTHVALTFRVTDGGEYVLSEYWQPRESSYTQDVEEKFGSVPKLEDYLAQQEAECLAQAEEHFAPPETLVSATMTFNGREVASITDEGALKQLRDMFAAAENLGYEPKTFLSGPTLTLVGSDGTTITGILATNNDLLRIGDAWYDYGPGYTYDGARHWTYRMIQIFGLENWPQWMYDYYEARGGWLEDPVSSAR